MKFSTRGTISFIQCKINYWK